MKLYRFGLAILAISGAAFGQSVVVSGDSLAGSPGGIMVPTAAGGSTRIPAYVSVAADGTVAAGGSGGGSLSAKANASAQTSVEGATTDPLSMDLSRRLRVRDDSVLAGINTLIAYAGDTTTPSPIYIDHTTPGTTDMVRIGGTLPAFAATPTVNIGTGGQGGTSGTPLYATLLSAGTPGSTAPTTANLIGGIGPSGNMRTLLTATTGGLLPGQAVPASTRTTITASTITTIAASAAGRVALEVQFETSPGANVFICMNGQSSTCSATVYDKMIASSAAAGTLYTAPLAPNGTIYAFTTASGVIVNVSSWTAQ
jgi:hypothetical protein